MPTPSRERYRPQIHFTAAKNWINDPNGLVYFEGEYHLFYQYNPHGNEWGHMSWGHAVSRDLLRWEELPVAIPEADGVMAYSGSAVVDWRNTGGFGTGEKPPLVAIYTGRRNADDRQSQCLAYSNDRGRTWTTFAGNPVLDIGSKNFRDPKVFWHEPTRCWVMVVVLGADYGLQLYRSADLKSWTLLSQFGPDKFTAGVWECPDLFPLPIVNDPSAPQKWVLLLNVNPGGPAGGSGCYYYVGDFDGERFIAESGPTPMDFGPDCYATVSWSDLPAQQNRRLAIGWMSNWQYARWTPTQPWRGAMTLPRELGLRKVDDRIVLTQWPAREFATLLGPPAAIQGDLVTMNQQLSLQMLTSPTMLVQIELIPGDATRAGVRVCMGGGEQTEIGFDGTREMLYVDRSRSGNIAFRPDFARPIEAPLKLRNGSLQLSIWIDACSIEVFDYTGEVAITQLIFPIAAGRGVQLFSDGTNTTAVCMINGLSLPTADSPARD